MRQTLTALLSAVVLALLGTTQLAAQGVGVANAGESAYGGAPNVPQIFLFESLEADSSFWGSYGFQLTDGWDDERDYAYWDNWEGEPMEGEGSLILDWGLKSDQDWGGSNALQHYLPDSLNGEPLPLYDFSDFTHINIWVNTLVPADPPAEWRLKLHDASEGLGRAPSSETEDWYSNSTTLYQEQPGWKLYSIPLESLGNVSPGSGGFSRPGCPASCWSGIYGNGELDLNMISGFQLEFTGGQFGPDADSSTAGTIVYDNFHVSGARYGLVHAFDQMEDLGNWINSTAGSYTLMVVDDTVEGTGAVELDYNLVSDQGWGGSVDIDYSPGSFLEDMSERTHLSLFYKVVEPASVSGQLNLTFKLWDNSTGTREEWQYNAGAIYEDTTGQWQRLLIPLVEAVGDAPGFAIPSWITDRGDEVLDLDKIDGIQMQMFGPEGTTTTGTIRFDRLGGYGFQVADFEAPAAVEGLEATTSDFSNVISWDDVPDEDGETYTLYYSESPIDDTEAAGVMVLERNIAEGTEVYIHRIFYPKADTEVSYYYAITASDPFDNVSEVSSTDAPVANTAMGIETISLSAPAFTADGDLSEWSGITPIHVDPANDYNNIPDGFTITDAADLSADVYMAMDETALYFAADVTDDSWNPVPEGHTDSRWTFDAIELYVGFYDGRREKHQNYGTEEDMRDFQINLYGETVISGQAGGDLFGYGDDYAVTQTDAGYNVEVRISYDVLGVSKTAAFMPQNGMRIPLDIVFMDNDLGGQDNREGILTYSPWNNDNSWTSPLYWFYTWAGDRESVGIEQVSLDVPRRFELEQNYPNPFNPSTLIRYHVARQGPVTLKIYNMLGQEVMTLVDAEQSAGIYEARFDASGLASGLYLYQLQADNVVLSKKMLLAR